MVSKIIGVGLELNTPSNRYWRELSSFYRELTFRAALEQLPYPIFQYIYDKLTEKLVLQAKNGVIEVKNSANLLLATLIKYQPLEKKR